MRTVYQIGAVLSGCAGVLGLGLGLLISSVITQGSGNLTIVCVEHVLMVLVITTAVDVGFGIQAAWRAAHMDLVEALRHGWSV